MAGWLPGCLAAKSLIPSLAKSLAIWRKCIANDNRKVENADVYLGRLLALSASSNNVSPRAFVFKGFWSERELIWQDVMLLFS